MLSDLLLSWNHKLKRNTCYKQRTTLLHSLFNKQLHSLAQHFVGQRIVPETRKNLGVDFRVKVTTADPNQYTVIKRYFRMEDLWGEGVTSLTNGRNLWKCALILRHTLYYRHQNLPSSHSSWILLQPYFIQTLSTFFYFELCGSYMYHLL